MKLHRVGAFLGTTEYLPIAIVWTFLDCNLRLQPLPFGRTIGNHGNFTNYVS